VAPIAALPVWWNYLPQTRRPLAGRRVAKPAPGPFQPLLLPPALPAAVRHLARRLPVPHPAVPEREPDPQVPEGRVAHQALRA
jgi:hypothetical protein